MKKSDYYFAAGIVALALIGWGVWQFFFSGEGAEVVVSRNGERLGSYLLEEDQTLTFEDGEGRRNTLVIREGQADMEEADCPDKLCVEHRPISRQGESMVCLPHKLVIEVKGRDMGDTDAIAR